MTAKEQFDVFLKEIRNLPFPVTLKVVHDWVRELRESNLLVKDKLWLHPSELAGFAKYLILFGSPITPNFIEPHVALNAYKSFWELSEEELPLDECPEAPGLEILRLSYQQYPFQVFEQTIRQNIYRTRRIFDEFLPHAGHSILETELGVKALEWLNCSLLLYERFKQSPHINADEIYAAYLGPPFQKVLKELSASQSQFERLCSRYEETDVLLKPYEFNPLLSKPITKLGNSYWCCFPELITFAATRGIYFRLLGTQGFREAFGDAFESYCAAIIGERKGNHEILTEKLERQLGWKGKTNDVTLIAGDNAFLFECKSSMLFAQSKKTGSQESVRQDIRKNLVNREEGTGLFQIAQKIEATSRGSLPPSLAVKYKNVKNYYGIVILHDQVQNANTERGLKTLLSAELAAAGKDSFPFQVWHVEELENLVRYCHDPNAFTEVMLNKFSSKEHSGWDLNTYLFHFTPQPHLRPSLFIPRGNGRFYKLIERIGDHATNRDNSSQ